MLATIALPPMIPVIAAIPPRRPGITLSSHFRALGGDLKLALILSALTIIFLADQAWLMADAIIRTLYRLCVSRKNLLEWVPAAQAADSRRLDLSRLLRRMHGALAIGALALVIAWVSGGGNALLAGALRERCGWPRPPSRARREPAAAHRQQRTLVQRRRASLAADRAPHLALFRNLRHPRRPHAAA